MYLDQTPLEVDNVLVDLGNITLIVGGIAAAVYIIETAGKYGYALLKKTSNPLCDNIQKML